MHEKTGERKRTGHGLIYFKSGCQHDFAYRNKWIKSV